MLLCTCCSDMVVWRRLDSSDPARILSHLLALHLYKSLVLRFPVAPIGEGNTSSCQGKGWVSFHQGDNKTQLGSLDIPSRLR